MEDEEYLGYLLQLRQEAIDDSVNREPEDRELMEYYFGEPFGDEVEGQSSVVSTDVSDVVESDMPSYVRVFLGGNEILKFTPNTESEKDVQEADEKTRYVGWIVRNQQGAFKKYSDWMKEADLLKTGGIVKYRWDETEIVKEHRYKNISSEEAVVLLEGLQDVNIEVEVTKNDQNEDGTINVTFESRRIEKGVKIENVPAENFLLTYAGNMQESELVGDWSERTRGWLVSQGYDEEIVKDLVMDTAPTGNSIKVYRNDLYLSQNQGVQQGTERGINHWTSQRVIVYDLYPMLDKDGDGIPERRHVVMVGNTVLLDEPFGRAPYAHLSAMSVPHSVIGRSRGEITKSTQRVKSVVLRQTLDNIYRVNAARVVATSDINLDDLSVNRPNGVVRAKKDTVISNSIMPLVTEYIGDKALQVIQYVDTARAQSTGVNLANQSLSSDALHKETATRFEGVQAKGDEKVELVVRYFAETGWKELYEGVAWLVSENQDEAKEIRYNGKPLTVDPRGWRYDHKLEANVGLASGDPEDQQQNMGILLTVQEQLKARGSTIVDDVKIYNTLSKTIKNMGFNNVSEFVNDPEVPQEQQQAVIEQLMMQLQQAQQLLQQSNPLAEQEQIKQQGKLMETQMKLQSDNQQFMAELVQKQEQMQQDQLQHNQDVLVRLTEIEARTNKDVPGSAI